MTRIHVTSDLHADFTQNRIDFPAIDCDLHLIVGDGAAPMTHALEILAESFRNSTAPLAYIPGNHDYYHSSRYPQSYMQDELARGRELGKALGIEVLSNDVLVVGDCRVLGSTLWTDMRAGDPRMSRKEKMLQSQRGYLEGRPGDKNYHNDFREIRYGAPGSKNRFTPSQWLQLHSEAMDWLRAEIAKEWSGTTVVATHMAPHPDSLMQGPGFDTHSWLYATTDVDFFENVDCWFHGHIHSARDYETIDGCRIIANPRGYPTDPRKRNAGMPAFENSNWDPGLVVEVQPKFTRRMTP
jgi:3',5'-cyclic AMP phosphodiesterase CpdA